MCGIVGVVALNEAGKAKLSRISHAVYSIHQRGPDDEGLYFDENIALGHRRLSVIDTSKAGAQPMKDASGRYTIIFNGEFFNYKEHRNFLVSKNIPLRSESDTEVLLQLYILEKEKCLEKINGFFSLAIYDRETEELFLARDRYGVKPLLIYEDDDHFSFASEMKALMSLGIKKELDSVSLFTYLQLNYIPAPWSIFKHVRKLDPGSYLKFSVKNKRISEEQKFYHLPYPSHREVLSYEESVEKIYSLLDQSVQRRMISDVPLGSFLSGGIDSSIISGLAARHTKHLKTFSIGFSDEPLFDETYFAQLVAKKHRTTHTTFKLKNDDLFEILFDTLNYLDEPFADSSALNVFMLSKLTRKKVTVALSGDGADEIFGGYNKHKAEWMVRNNRLFTTGMKMLSPLLKGFSGSRNSKAGNYIRQVHRFAGGAKMLAQERYWRWCGFSDQDDIEKLYVLNDTNRKQYEKRKQEILKDIHGSKHNMNDVFASDVNLVLQSDMLTKVDLMSMANSLEVRTPFLDYEVVDFAFSLPSVYKIDGTTQKKILKDAFKELLPDEILHRKKQGFEVPLLNWFRTDLKSMIMEELLNDQFILEQGIFNLQEIQKLRIQLFSNNPGEIHARIWGLVVFQYWWKKNMIN